MADVTIEAAAGNYLFRTAVRAGTFWTTPLIGYVIYPDTNHDLVYRKTTDGGANWGAALQVVAPGSCDIPTYDCHPDWQTAGDAGTKIHIIYMSWDTEEVRYVYLDTNGDSVSGDVLIETCQGTGTFRTSRAIGIYMASITKTRGGNLAVAFKYHDGGAGRWNAFYTSSDATNWTSKTNPYEVDPDYCLLFPANLADNQDLWAAYWDVDADEISLKTFDNSGNSWGEQLISGSMAYSGLYLQMDGQIDLDTGELFFAAWSQYDNVASNLKTWLIDGAGSITPKANVITEEAENFLVSVFIDQITGDRYITYVQGTAAQDLVKCVYQKSVNGGTSWGGELTMQADGEDDMRWVSAGCMKAAWGGKFQPVWFDDDDNDLFTNSDNGISIIAIPVVEGSASGSGIGLGTSAAFLNVLASASGEGIGLGTSAAILDVLASASGEGIGLGTSEAILDVLASASGEGVGSGVSSALLIVLAEADGSGIGSSEATAILDVLGIGSGSGIGTGITAVYFSISKHGWNRSLISGDKVDTGWGRVLVSGDEADTGWNRSPVSGDNADTGWGRSPVE